MPAGKGDGGAELPDPWLGRRSGSFERTAVQDAGDHREDEQRNRHDRVRHRPEPPGTDGHLQIGAEAEARMAAMSVMQCVTMACAVSTYP